MSECTGQATCNRQRTKKDANFLSLGFVLPSTKTTVAVAVGHSEGILAVFNDIDELTDVQAQQSANVVSRFLQRAAIFAGASQLHRAGCGFRT